MVIEIPITQVKTSINRKDLEEEIESMSPDKLKKEINQYRKLVKAQRKVLESLSEKVLSQEKLRKNLSISEKRILNLKEQLEYYKAKGKILERELGEKRNLSKQIFEEIQRGRGDRSSNQ
jgi:predicted RNase H-like nuclease (RuvC/YqgF family)